MKLFKNKITFILILLLIVLLDFGCQQKKRQPKILNTKIISVELNKIENDTVPFCEFFVVDQKVNKPLSDEKQLKFTPIEWRAIDMENSDLRKLMDEPVSGLKISKINFVYGIDKNKNNIICFDANNNGKFTDDKYYPINENIPFIKISNIKILVNGNYKTRDVYIKAEPGMSVISVNDKKLNSNKEFNLSFFMMPTIISGVAELGSDSFRLALCNYTTEQLFNAKRTLLCLVPKDSLFLPCSFHQIQYSVGDTMYLGKSIYKFDSITKFGNKIFLEELSNENKRFGIEQGYFAFPIVSRDLLTGIKYSTDTIKKYLLLDFWGTWCKPCVEMADDLKEMNSFYANRPFQMISIAKDESQNVVREYLKKENIQWINFYDKSTESTICNKYKIQAFPTFIVIDDTGRIVLRAVGKEGFISIKNFLQKKLNRY